MNIDMGARTLATYEAMKAVKAALRAEGRKLSEFKHRELVARAELLLDINPIYVTTARELMQRWAREGKLGKRVQAQALAVHKTTEV